MSSVIEKPEYAFLKENENLKGNICLLTIGGSRAYGTNIEGSDIDVLVLVDSPQEEISHREWEIGDIAGELLLNYGVLVSPVVENRDYYQRNAEILPFFRNIQREGVRMNA